MKARAITDLHYSWYLKFFQITLAWRIVQFWDNFRKSLIALIRLLKPIFSKPNLLLYSKCLEFVSKFKLFAFRFFSFFFLLLYQKSVYDYVYLCYGLTNSAFTVWLWHAKMSQFLHGHLHQPCLLVKEIPSCTPQRQSYRLTWRISFEWTPQHQSPLQYKPNIVKYPLPVAVVHHWAILEDGGDKHLWSIFINNVCDEQVIISGYSENWRWHTEKFCTCLHRILLSNNTC